MPTGIELVMLDSQAANIAAFGRIGKSFPERLKYERGANALRGRAAKKSHGFLSQLKQRFSTE